MTWHPDNDCPTDGRPVLKVCRNGSMYIAPAAGPSEEPSEFVKAAIARDTGAKYDPGWVATHWMDLPDPPEALDPLPE